MPPHPKQAISSQHSSFSSCPDLPSLGADTKKNAQLVTMDHKDMVGNVGGIENWGYPGYLTEKEYKIFCKFRNEVTQRDEAFQQTVFSFAAAQELEEYALCRWLRARKFEYEKVIEMVNEAKSLREGPSKSNFFPDARDALGVEPSLYLSQYPHTYYSYTRDGYPLYFSKPGVLNVTGLECITTIQGILNYHWYDMMHNYQSRLCHTTNKRYEAVLVLDLDHLTSSQLSKRAVRIMNIQTSIDSLCFPETLHRMLIINAPSFFTMTWKILKKWVDVRTSNKVEIYGKTASVWKARLHKLVDPDNLPQDYAGTNTSLDNYILQQTCSSSFAAQIPQLIRLRGNSTISRTFTLKSQEFFRVSIFTRSLQSAILHIIHCNDMKKKLHSQRIQHNGVGKEEESPTRVDITLPSSSCPPGTYKILLESCSNKIYQTESFLIVTWIHPVTNDVANDSDNHEDFEKEQLSNSLSDCIIYNTMPSVPSSPDSFPSNMYAPSIVPYDCSQDMEEGEDVDEDEIPINIYKKGGIKYLIQEEDTNTKTSSNGFLCGGFFDNCGVPDILSNLCNRSHHE